MDDYILAIDQGTTQTTALVVDGRGRIVARARRAVPNDYPRPGWVEVSPRALLESVTESGREAVAAAGVAPERIRCLALANQGETALAWDRDTGDPVAPAISWQDRRTDEFCEGLRTPETAEKVAQATGLPLESYFSASKWRWILDNVDEARRLHRQGRLLLGTTDAYLVWHLTRGGLHVTDHATASRTLLFNIHRRAWDDHLLGLFGIPAETLPTPLPHDAPFGTADRSWFGAPLSLRGLCVDQQAALFGQACFQTGNAKVTYGTGSFALLNVGDRPPTQPSGVLTTLGWTLEGRTTYALDGGIYTTGAAVRWLVDQMGLISDPAESEELARAVPDSGGVHVVPAFTGLGAPFWDSRARGHILGLTLATRREHVVRATLEGIAFRTRDVIEEMSRVSGWRPESIRVDGGLTANGFLMQFQADVLGLPVEVADQQELTGLGVAYLAGVARGQWTLDDVAGFWKARRTYLPSRDFDRETAYRAWRAAVRRTLTSLASGGGEGGG